MIEFVTGKPITRLVARTSIVQATRGGRTVETEDAVALVVELADGAIGTLLISQVSAGRKNQLAFEISTETDTFAFDQERPDSLWVGRVDGPIELPRDPRLLAADAGRLVVVPVGHPMGYPDAIASFVGDVYRTIRGEHVDGLPTFADGLRAVRLTEAVLVSASTNQWVETPAHVRDPVLTGTDRS
jgi:predicted dehydrogenase